MLIFYFINYQKNTQTISENNEKNMLYELKNWNKKHRLTPISSIA